ncbi:MAG: CDP-diacylglycerol diphosphatase [Alsobacter sp.]
MRRRAIWGAGLLVLAVVGLGASQLQSSDMLGHVVALCATSEAHLQVPLPCSDVRRIGNGAGAYIVKVPFTSKHPIAVPFGEIDGLEIPDFAGQTAADAVSIAWNARDVLSAGGKTPRWDEAGLAINSFAKRTQDRLHLHIDCLDRSVRSFIADHPGEVGEGWEPYPPDRRLWWRRAAAAEVLADPVAAWHKGLPPTLERPLRLNLGLAGAPPLDGEAQFVLFASTAVSVERILDQTCRVQAP